MVIGDVIYFQYFKAFRVAEKGRCFLEAYKPKCTVAEIDRVGTLDLIESVVSRMVNIRIGFTASENLVVCKRILRFLKGIFRLVVELV